MTVNLAILSQRTGLAVLDHLEKQVAIPVIDGLQAQGDLLIVPLRMIATAVSIDNWATWREVPADGFEVLRGAAGGNPHTLVADASTCHWTTQARDTFELAIGIFRNTKPAYMLHPEHGATGFSPGVYVVRRQRELGHSRGGRRLVAD
ncbi:hypothetical protein [Sinosporangium siamense]|uniref:Uncharacterized protein n=1 Tax=Sinosporangium siamense TaxID=1367973 RepID=A0A919VGF6_9ACTN|nr:hypothetical protein [Sinosporangium siamense]GII97054.1 hypothetical protein Ssi02_72850 [Sinosporangium siamense]